MSKHPVDIYVGKRVRHRRWMVAMSQQQLAEKVGIKFQQIQKYETGMNRISASRLWEIAAALRVDVQYFFDGMDAKTSGGTTAWPEELMADREAHKSLMGSTIAAIASPTGASCQPIQDGFIAVKEKTGTSDWRNRSAWLADAVTQPQWLEDSAEEVIRPLSSSL